ncbi:NUDIX hydrolase domain-like protein [Fennellomyces sp. T-0311]|nr:NUDIX hydrolase domain-like protein [Fennellomyces sp. T-0311]
MPEQIVRVGVGCFVKTLGSDGTVKVLIGRRKGSHGAGAWQLPGGHLEFNESFEDCARREVLEETNLDIENITFVTTTNDIMTAENKHYVTVFMQGTAKDIGKLRTMEPHKLDGDWQWVSFEDIEQYTPLFIPLANLLRLPQRNAIAASLTSM